MCLTLHGLVHMSMATTFLIPIMARGGYMVADRSLRGPPARPRVPLTGAIRPVKSYTLNDFSASFKTSERRDFFFSLVSPCGLRLCGEPIHFTACLASFARGRLAHHAHDAAQHVQAQPATADCDWAVQRDSRLAIFVDIKELGYNLFSYLHAQFSVGVAVPSSPSPPIRLNAHVIRMRHYHLP